jgi:hypothetical protein
MSKRVAAIILFCLVASLYSNAQVTPVITASKEKIFIGEPFTLKLELKAIERNATVQWKFPDSIPHFEYVRVDTSNLFKREITLASFDSGVWAIENIEVIVPSNVNGQPQLLRFPAKEIVIEYDTTGNQLLNDVKPIIDVNAGEEWIGYAVAAAAVLSLIALIILFRRWKKKKQIAVSNESKYTALEDFLLLTEKLKKEDWDTQLAQKKNFSDLDHGIKRFYERKLHQPFTRLTTDELALQLKQYVLNESLISIIQTLRLSDAVKFAKFNPGKEECVDAVTQMEAIIRKSDTELNSDA